MKPNYPGLFLLGIFALGTIASMGRPQSDSSPSPFKGEKVQSTTHSTENNLVVHEWGTFTSFQGGDGELLSWKPLVTSALPEFVYDWKKPGLGRVTYNPLMFSKGSMTTLQRMETPVVYFYSDKALTADLSVQFPQGLITEWYPQAREIGPSFVAPSKRLTSLDSFIHKCGAPAGFSFASTFGEKAVSNSVIHWSNIRILPPESRSDASTSLPVDTSGTHYFAARETDANLLRLDSLSPTNSQPQYEKFLFYRGAGSFATPLRVTMKTDDAVTLANTGTETLNHLFILDARDKAGGFIHVARLLPGEEKTVRRLRPDQFLTPTELTKSLSDEMSAALVKEGLYPREAAAMINTWKSSWFAENGTRVLYVLPRTWTDQTLPMTLNPAPRELTRVMVGRAEVLTPGLEQRLITQLDKARQGDSEAMAQVHETVKNLGRFAEPAFYRALAKIKPQPSEPDKLARLLFNESGTEFE